MYNLFWRSPALPFTQKQVAINVPPGTIVSNAASIRLTGKGMTNYGKIQQENLLRLLENFAGPTEPEYPTVGQLWYDTSISVLKICVSTAPDPIVWEQLNAYQVSEVEPSNPSLGDIWFKVTGPHSGILYVYDGIGRFPEKTWNAVTEGYYQQPTSPTLGAKVNVAAFSQAEGDTPGRFHLFAKDTSGNFTNAQGSVLVAGQPYFIANDVTYTAGVKAQKGYIMLETADLNVINATFTNDLGVGLERRIYFVVPTEDGTWLYDNGTTLKKFTPTASQFIVGIMETSAAGSTISSVAVWSNAVAISRYVRFVASAHPKGKCGGWQQIWPAVDYIGARDEYDAIYGKLMKLIGDPIASDGSGAINKFIDYLPNLEVLDASLQTIILASPDANIFEPSANDISTLKVLPTSQDWDLLLAACRYAINRLEMAPDAVSDVPAFGFVQDGLPLHPTILNSNPSDQKYLSSYVYSRRTNKKMGMMSCFVSFQELMNILDYANRTKHVLKGTYEASGSSQYASGVINNTHAVFNGNGPNLTGTKTLDITLPFSNTHDLESFLNSGGCFMVEASAEETSGTPSNTADLSLQNLLAVRGKLKVNGSSSLVFNYGSNTAMSANAIATGFDTIQNGASTTVHTSTVAPISMSWSIGKTTNGAGLRVILSITTSTALTNQITVRASYIMDDVKYVVDNVLYNVYAKPLPFNSQQYTGTGVTVSPTVYTTSSGFIL